MLPILDIVLISANGIAKEVVDEETVRLFTVILAVMLLFRLAPPPPPKSYRKQRPGRSWSPGLGLCRPSENDETIF